MNQSQFETIQPYMSQMFEEVKIDRQKKATKEMNKKSSLLSPLVQWYVDQILVMLENPNNINTGEFWENVGEMILNLCNKDVKYFIELVIAVPDVFEDQRAKLILQEYDEHFNVAERILVDLAEHYIGELKRKNTMNYEEARDKVLEDIKSLDIVSELTKIQHSKAKQKKQPNNNQHQQNYAKRTQSEQQKHRKGL